MPAKKVAAAIEYEAQHQLPIALAELCWSSQVLDEGADKTADQSPRRVLIQAAREAQVRERLGAFKSAGIVASGVQNDCLALYAALANEQFGATKPEDLTGAQPAGRVTAIAAIDVGEEATNVVVYAPRCVWFRTFTIGAGNFVRELVKQLKLTGEQAQELLCHPAKARRFGQWQAAIQPLIVQLTGEVERSLTTYARLYPDRPIQQVYGLGGGFQIHGLLRFLRSGK
jgi:Tfp pilus assembly PilM family ATPase